MATDSTESENEPTSEEAPTARTSDGYPQHATLIDVLFRHGGKILAILPITILGCFALAKARPEDIPKLIDSIFSSKAFSWMGWIVAVFTFVFALILSLIMRQIYPKELRRVCRERDKLQALLLKKEVQHSGRKD